MSKEWSENDLEYNKHFYDKKDGMDNGMRALYESGIIDIDGNRTEEMKDVTGFITINGMFDCKINSLYIMQWNKDEASFEDFKQGVYNAADELIKEIENRIENKED